MLRMPCTARNCGLTTHDAQALAAIHSFLRFQIQEYQTGDSIKLNETASRSSTNSTRGFSTSIDSA
jgi:hypothetical protein